MDGQILPEIMDSETYWIHPDHLGSSSVLSNSASKITNWYEYMPFGEPLMELSTRAYDNPYKFNGKELDSQTGLYYYGARYYDPQRSFWLSIDPLVEITMSPYAYTWNDPVNYTDPTGMIGERIGDPGGPNINKIYDGGTIEEVIIRGIRNKPGMLNLSYRGNSGGWNASSVYTNSTRFNISLFGLVDLSKNFTFNYPVTGARVQIGFDDFYFKDRATAWAYIKAINNLDDINNNVAHHATFDKSVTIGSKTYDTSERPRDFDYGDINGQALSELGCNCGAVMMGAMGAGIRTELPRGQRLSMFKSKLSRAPNPTTPQGALKLINKTLDGIELNHAGANDRMFGILDNKYVTYHSSGNVTALTKSHRIEIKANGMFKIFDRRTGNLFFKK
ncbi:hypothetical protein GCM10022217_25110 [Chryseobacterium ginsenosidimutans]